MCAIPGGNNASPRMFRRRASSECRIHSRPQNVCATREMFPAIKARAAGRENGGLGYKHALVATIRELTKKASRIGLVALQLPQSTSAGPTYYPGCRQSGQSTFQMTRAIFHSPCALRRTIFMNLPLLFSVTPLESVELSVNVPRAKPQSPNTFTSSTDPVQ